MKPDFYNINPNVTLEKSLEERFFKERLEWNDKIEEMSGRMRKILEIPELMTYLYTERQRAVEYYHYLISLLININRQYRVQYSEKWDYYTSKSNIRYPNETSKDMRIKKDLADLLEKREILENHSKFILACVQTLDNIIFAIPRRIEIENIARGK